MAGWLGFQIKAGLEEAWRVLDSSLVHRCGEWGKATSHAVTSGIEAGLKILDAAKDKIVGFCRENKEVMETLAKLGTKAYISKVAAKAATRQVAKSVVKESVKAGSKSLIKAANPLGIAADVVQVGLEYAGYDGLGQTVGMNGNIVSGAMLGAAVGGPVGAAAGAAGGFLVWGVGEAVGGVVNMLFE